MDAELRKPTPDKKKTAITYRRVSPGHVTVMKASIAAIPRRAQMAMPEIAILCRRPGGRLSGGSSSGRERPSVMTLSDSRLAPLPLTDEGDSDVKLPSCKAIRAEFVRPLQTHL